MNDGLLRILIEASEKIQEQIVGISRYIHDHPELSGQEELACACLTRMLREQGFVVTTGLAGLPTAFRAEYNTERAGATVAFIAEYDALPEIGHGCGHNLIAASAVGAGLILRQLEHLLGGRILVFGTPAEETFGAKIPLLEQGWFAGIDAAIMLHPENINVVRGGALAVNSLTFRFFGKSAHAASNPEKGINALDAVLLTFANINALRQQTSSDVRIHGIISKGGIAPNIIPEEAEAKFYVRSAKRLDLDVLVERVKNCARGAALATGCQLVIEEPDFPNDELLNNPVLSALIKEYMQYFGLHDILEDDPCPGSTDFGNVSQVIPAAYGFVATVPPGVEIHSREFAQSQCTIAAEQGLMIMVKILAAVGIDVLTKPDLVEGVWQHFKSENRSYSWE